MGVGVILGCLTPHPPVFVPAVAGERVEQVRQSVDAMRCLAAEIGELAPETLLLISPHAPVDPLFMSVSVADRFSGSLADFGAPSVKVSAEGDPSLVSALRVECAAQGVPLMAMSRPGATHHLDHGACVPLYFLREAGVDSALTLVSFSSLNVGLHLRFGEAIAAAARSSRRRVVLVASGDMSHRLIPGAPAGFSPAGNQFDQTIVTLLKRGDYPGILSIDDELLYQAGECGYRALVIALGALPNSKPEVLSYEGPFGVGYLVARFVPPDTQSAEVVDAATNAARVSSEPEESEVLHLARAAVEIYVREGRVIEPPSHAAGVLGSRAGVFVCLKSGGDLRGCIGTFQPTEGSVAAEIVRNAVAAASCDPRFQPVCAQELPLLHYSVDILSNPEPVEGMDQLDPNRYGVIVQSGIKKGLLLPDLEGVSTVSHQVEIARGKAGIPPWAEMDLFRFTVRRISE